MAHLARTCPGERPFVMAALLSERYETLLNYAQMLCYLLTYRMVKFYYSYEHDLRNRNAPLVTEHVIRRWPGSLAAQRFGGDDAIATTLRPWLRHTSVVGICFDHKILLGIKPTVVTHAWPRCRSRLFAMHGHVIDSPPRTRCVDLQQVWICIRGNGITGEWHHGGMASRGNGINLLCTQGIGILTTHGWASREGSTKKTRVADTLYRELPDNSSPASGPSDELDPRKLIAGVPVSKRPGCEFLWSQIYCIVESHIQIVTIMQ